MLVTCPNCQSKFKVPDIAIGPTGRMVRCSRCHDKWRQMPETGQKGGGSMAAPAPAPAAALADALAAGESPGWQEPPPPDSPEEASVANDLLAQAMEDEARETADSGGNPMDRIAEMMMEAPPAPIPDVFASPVDEPEEPRRRGAVGLWLILILLVLVIAGGVLFLFQDRVIERWPAAARYYEMAHLRNQVVGADLKFRDYSSERLVQNGTEVLVVRGVIANNADKPRQIPYLRLALYDGKTLLQETVIDPPQPTLDAQGTIGFKITLDQPDPHASRFEVTFVQAKPMAGKMAPDMKPAEGAGTQSK